VSGAVVRPYVICATPRSGSYLLCEALWSTGVLGRPAEYFLHWFELERQPGQRDTAHLRPWLPPPAQYVARVTEEGATPNGVFGVKIMWTYLDLVIDRMRTGGRAQRPWEVLPAAWPGLRYIHMARRDKVGQAVSMAKAMQSGKWVDVDWSAPSDMALALKRVFAGTLAAKLDPDLGGSRTQPRPLTYDFDQLAGLYQMLCRDEEAWNGYFRAAGVEPFRVVYEDFVGSYRQTALDIAGYLGVEGVEDLAFAPRHMKRQADSTNDDWARRFREQLAASGPSR
jgi:LPS sulfotransferase NodH